MLGSAAQGGEEQGWGRACEVLGLQWAHVGPVWAGSGCWGELCRVLGSIWPWVGAGLAEVLQVTLGLFCEAGLGSGVPGVGARGGGGKDLSRCSTCSRKAGWQVRSKTPMFLSAVLSTYCLAVAIACRRTAHRW